MAAAIADVERELDTALANLDGWAESALAREKGRIAELRAALSAQARRIREMDVLLAGVAAAGDAACGRRRTRPTQADRRQPTPRAAPIDRPDQRRWAVAGGASRPGRRTWPGWRRCGGKRMPI